MSRRPRPSGAMHVVTNRRQGVHREYVTHLLRRSYREGGKVQNETLANLSHLPDELIEVIRGALAGRRYLDSEQAFAIERSLPAGHVQAALQMARRLELGRLLDRAPSRARDLCLAMIVQQALRPGSKLQTARSLAQSTLGSELGVATADEDDLYGALDWLLERQARIEDRLGARHLGDGELVLYDVSSSYFEGRTCPLAKLGYSRDGKRGTPQIVYGLLCDRLGRPLCVEVFTGELHDDKTLPVQVAKLKARFALKTVIVVCDRGMVTKANLELMSQTDGVAWITALKAPPIKTLVTSGTLQLSLFDEHNLAEITAPEDYPGERLVVGRNPLIAAERAQARGTAGRHRARPRRDPSTRQARHAAGLRSDRPRARPGAQALPRQKALRGRDHRHHLHLRAQDRADPGRGRAGRLLRAPHERSRGHARQRSGGARLQGPRTGRARVRHLQGPRARDPPDPPPPRGPRPRARVAVHARLLPHLAPASGLGATALQRRAAAHQLRPGSQGPPLTRRQAQGTNQVHHQRRALPQLPQPDRRARDPDPQHHPPPRRARNLRQTHRTDPTPSPRTRPRRDCPRPRVVTTPTPRPTRKARRQATFPHPTKGNFGLGGEHRRREIDRKASKQMKGGGTEGG